MDYEEKLKSLLNAFISDYMEDNERMVLRVVCEILFRRCATISADGYLCQFCTLRNLCKFMLKEGVKDEDR